MIGSLFEGNRVILGVVNQKNVFVHEEPNQHIDAGSTYTSSFTPPIPGRWRMSGRVDGEYYTSDVYDGDFTFTSPVSGILEVLLMYLYDRTGETPADVNTPMDIYRETIGGLATGTISGTVTDKDTGSGIKGATVTAKGYSNTTDVNRDYTISNVPAGTYAVTASATGYYSQIQENIEVRENQTTAVNFQLIEAPDHVGEWLKLIRHKYGIKYIIQHLKHFFYPRQGLLWPSQKIFLHLVFFPFLSPFI